MRCIEVVYPRPRFRVRERFVKVVAHDPHVMGRTAPSAFDTRGLDALLVVLLCGGLLVRWAVQMKLLVVLPSGGRGRPTLPRLPPTPHLPTHAHVTCVRSDFFVKKGTLPWGCLKRARDSAVSSDPSLLALARVAHVG